MKLVNKDNNLELLNNVPYVEFLDLAIIFIIDIPLLHREIEGTVTISNKHMEIWGIDKEELFDNAKRNSLEKSPAVIKSMNEVIRDMYINDIASEIADDDEIYAMLDSAESYLYVLTNEAKHNGAITMTYENVIRDFANEKESNVYILPSSIHELILVPAEGSMSTNELKDMVQSVNQSHLDEVEVLSNNVYYYDRKKDKITIKSLYQKQYETLSGYCERLKNYARHIEICGESRNSYSKTDHDATFMRVKSDYMGNDQLLPAYNLQAAVCDEYIVVIDAKPYASDMECFVPLMEKYNATYGHYPKYPVADAGYGSYNNYLYCEEHGMEKYMKFTMFDKETKDSKYHNNPFRVDNFKRDEKGNLICPNGKRFLYKYDKHVRGNKYGRTEEIYECEDCTNCPYKDECCKRTSGNRTARLNRELTAIYHEVIDNLESVHGALLRMNRSIQAEGTFGVIKWDRTYKRLFRRGEKAVILEFTLISCGFNLYKYHNKINRQTLAA